MQDAETLVFAEVRYRRNLNFGGGQGSVDRTKQYRLAKVASYFLQCHRAWQTAPCRFDVVAVSGSSRDPSIEWVAHAFEDPRR